jgi:glucose/arabinose dehydrogenase
MTVTPQLRAIVLVGALAILALLLGFETLNMNRASSATPKTIPPVTARDRAEAPKQKPKTTVDPHVAAALRAGLPRSVARALGADRVVVVELYSSADEVDGLARAEAESGAALAGAGFVAVDVHRDGDSAKLTSLLGALPPSPAALVYRRPATLFVTLPGFTDRTMVQQAATNASQ